jgi:DNA modification methylase
MTAAPEYRAFLEAKAVTAPEHGFAVEPGEVNPLLKPFVRDCVVPWAAKRGRAAIFSSFGLHKTSTQIELARLALKRGAVPLIVLPLGVRQEFMDDAGRFFTGEHAVTMRFIRRTAEADERSINLTNYESVRDGKIDLAGFGFASLDEAAVLRGFGGTKTFREFMRLFAPVRWRTVATATPDPNEYIELLAYAAYLGVMDVGQAKTRFFRRDSEHADRLTIHPHKEREFWLWVASWALFIRRPSDLGYSDDGYAMPPLDIRWHEVKSLPSTPVTDRHGQTQLFRNVAGGISQAAREKRESLADRVAKMMELRAEDPGAHRIIWHDLEAEREAIERAILSDQEARRAERQTGTQLRSIYGAQNLEANEQAAIDFKYGRFAELATKPQMSGAGCNFQRFCHRAIYLGIGHKFHDFIQSVHRLQRFGQDKPVRIDLIYTEAERPVRANLEAKWKRHEEQAEVMSRIVRDYGLARAALDDALGRSIGVDRVEVTDAGSRQEDGNRQSAIGNRDDDAEGAPSDCRLPTADCRSDWTYRLINNDCVDEVAGMEDASVHLIVTSIPFSTQYEYTPSYNDFGHTDDDRHFWAQMDYLTPELLRVLQPGRIAAIHVKDRIVPGGMTGLGFQTVSPFSDDCVAHFRRHGFAFLARKTIVTDVVRENNQTYRLGWTEQCKDGSRMGAGLPEYLLIFRKPQTDRSHGYADVPVAKDKKEWVERGYWKNPDGYSRARWQLDAHGFTRSSGDRPLAPEDLIGVAPNVVYKLWKAHSLSSAYDFAHHVACGEALEERGALPPTFMLLPPHSWHPEVWTDVTRMRTLNGSQAMKGRELHLCPLQFDIVDRAIVQFTMKGETVLDPFGGLMTVPYCALKLGRRGIGIELNHAYFRDGVAHVQEAAASRSTVSLFELAGVEEGSRQSAVGNRQEGGIDASAVVPSPFVGEGQGEGELTGAADGAA